LRQQVRAAIGAERYAEAVAVCQHILRWAPRDGETVYLLGEAHLEAGQFARAEAFFRLALGINPEQYLVHAGLGLAAEHQGDRVSALTWLRRALDLNPANLALRGEIERLAEELGLTAPTVARPSQVAVGRTYLRGKMYVEAAQHLARAVAEEPDRVEARLALAEALWMLGAVGVAEQVTLGTLQIAPNCVKALTLLAILHLERDQHDEAEALLQAAAALDPDQGLIGDVFALVQRPWRPPFDPLELPPPPEHAPDVWPEVEIRLDPSWTPSTSPVSLVPDVSFLFPRREEEATTGESSAEGRLATWVAPLPLVASAPGRALDEPARDEPVEAPAAAPATRPADLREGQDEDSPAPEPRPAEEAPSPASDAALQPPSGAPTMVQEPFPRGAAAVEPSSVGPSVDAGPSALPAAAPTSVEASGPAAYGVERDGQVEAPTGPTEEPEGTPGPSPEALDPIAAESGAAGPSSVDPAPLDLIERARAAFARADAEEGLACCRRALDREPERVSEVIALLAEASSAQPTVVTIRWTLGDLLVQQGRLVDGFLAYRQAQSVEAP
jgi:tetratricopeptide (TPR) repeat protein